MTSSSSTTPSSQKSPLLFWGVLLVWCVLVGVILALSPNEKDLKSGIKIVYVHVAAIWTGLSLYVISGVFGVGAVALGRMFWLRWGRVLLWMAIAWYGFGVGASLAAAKINWGAIFWSEPRLAMSLRVLIVSLPIAAGALWVRAPRWGGLVVMGPVAFLLFSLWMTPLVLHPRNPIQSATSASIQYTFLGLFVLFLAFSLWLTRYLAPLLRPLEAPIPDKAAISQA